MDGYVVSVRNVPNENTLGNIASYVTKEPAEIATPSNAPMIFAVYIHAEPMEVHGAVVIGVGSGAVDLTLLKVP